MRKATLLVAVVASGLLLGACNPFFKPVHEFSLIGMGEGGVMTCSLVRFRVEFDGRVVSNSRPYLGDLDGTWVHDPRTADFPNLQGQVFAEAGRPGWGAAFEVRVDCLDEAQQVLGVTLFRGRLVAPRDRTSFRVLNFPPPADGRPCLPPTEGSGVTLCAAVDGFVLD